MEQILLTTKEPATALRNKIATLQMCHMHIANFAKITPKDSQYISKNFHKFCRQKERWLHSFQLTTNWHYKNIPFYSFFFKKNLDSYFYLSKNQWSKKLFLILSFIPSTFCGVNSAFWTSTHRNFPFFVPLRKFFFSLFFFLSLTLHSLFYIRFVFLFIVFIFYFRFGDCFIFRFPF